MKITKKLWAAYLFYHYLRLNLYIFSKSFQCLKLRQSLDSPILWLRLKSYFDFVVVCLILAGLWGKVSEMHLARIK